MCCTGGEGEPLPSWPPPYLVPTGPQEYKLECAGDQLQSLSVYEDECGRKDGVIVELRRELAAYKHNSHTKDIRSNNLVIKTSPIISFSIDSTGR